MKKKLNSYLEYAQSLDPNMHVVDTADKETTEEEILQYLAEIIISIHKHKILAEQEKHELEEQITQ
ncbi:hypothetical protein ESA94_18295 [Lacibacter luteus]|uniref:Uncharacterized protein n=1 Tax=Lacibacter luteus TaxID=2508719 RepID=A0A4Q1CFY3_9BACT|nr:hypothetical protein [Lacibacter luteus]RXK58582.1 hypothetical protein ESA94_18295 [Lacibacter luteus]